MKKRNGGTRAYAMLTFLLTVAFAIAVVGLEACSSYRGQYETDYPVQYETVARSEAETFEAAQLDRRQKGKKRRAKKNERLPNGVQQRMLNVGGRNRTFYLYVPQQVAGAPAPLVVAFHGGGGRPLPFARRIGLKRMADRHGFVVAAPRGEGRGRGGSWNAESMAQAASGYAEQAGIDDVAFVAALLSDIRAVTPINTARVYAMGLSLGGMMAYHAACELPGRFAAIAVVAGTMSSRSCTSAKGVSLLHIHGTADQNVPWEGGRGDLTGGNTVWPPVMRGISIWNEGNRCRDQQPGLQVTQDTTCQMTRCGSSEVVQVCRVQGGGHAWPGTKPAKWQKNTGTYVSPHFNATEYIADFFDSH